MAHSYSLTDNHLKELILGANRYEGIRFYIEIPRMHCKTSHLFESTLLLPYLVLLSHYTRRLIIIPVSKFIVFRKIILNTFML